MDGRVCSSRDVHGEFFAKRLRRAQLSAPPSLTLAQVSFQPKTAWWAAIFDVGVCGVYSNTLLVNLNGRDFAAGEPEVSHSPVSAQSTKHGPLRGSKNGQWSDSKHEPSRESTATEAILPFEAAKRSQVSEARTAEEGF